MKQDLVKYFEENCMFYDLQFGFRSGHSVHDAVYSVLDCLWRARNEGLYSSIAFLDLSKAFNCIQHPIILDKLQHYGGRGICLKWFSSCLSERSQFTQIN